MTMKRARILLTLLLLALLAIGGAAGAAFKQCGLLATPLIANACPPRRAYAPLPARVRRPPTFPSGGRIVEVTGDELHELLVHAARHGGAPVVALFHLAGADPNSVGMRALAECLPAYVPASVPFVAVEYGRLSLVQLLAHALHALPVLQVTVGGKRYRYRGRHRLEPVLAFLSRALGRELAGPPSAPALCAADPARCGGWRCARPDGEATLEELARPPSPALRLSAAFLALRAGAWLWHRRRRQQQQQQQQQAQQQQQQHQQQVEPPRADGGGAPAAGAAAAAAGGGG